MLKKGSSLRKLFSRKKSKKKKEDNKPSHQNIDSSSFQEIILAPNYRRENFETKVKETGNQFESSLSQPLDGIRKQEATTTLRLNAKIAALTKQRDEMKNKLESSEKKYRNLRKMFGEASKNPCEKSDPVQMVGGCSRKDNLSPESKKEAKISSDELSSASSNEAQTKKAREVDLHKRSEASLLQRYRKTGSGSTGTTRDNVDTGSLEEWIRDTNKTIRDMQSCLVEVKGKLFEFSDTFESFLKIYSTKEIEDPGQTKQKTNQQQQQQQLCANDFETKQTNSQEQEQEQKQEQKQQQKQQQDKIVEQCANDLDNENQEIPADICHGSTSINDAEEMSKSAVQAKQWERVQSKEDGIQEFCVENIDSKLGSFQQIAGQNDTDVGIHEHVAFQRDVEDCGSASQGKQEHGADGLLPTHCLTCLLEQMAAHQIVVKTCCNTTFLNCCKCACSDNNTTISSGYISQDTSSSSMGSNSRWDNVCVDSNNQYHGASIQAGRRLGDWGLTGDDYIQRHIVTSSPIIATLRDLKLNEV